MFVFLILMLQFTVTEQLFSVVVRPGDDVTLTCEHVKDDQDECQNIEWIYIHKEYTKSYVLVRNGQIVASRSNRLRLGEKCSLVIKNVTDQDAGRYSCRQDEETQVFLSVVTMTEQKLEHLISFDCSVSTNTDCKESVQWLNRDEVFRYQTGSTVSVSETLYYAVVSFEDSQFNSAVMNSLTCEVTDCYRNVHQFLFRPQASGEDTKPATTESTTVENSVTALINEASAEKQGWWRIIIVSVGLTTLIITVVTVNM